MGLCLCRSESKHSSIHWIDHAMPPHVYEAPSARRWWTRRRDRLAESPATELDRYSSRTLQPIGFFKIRGAYNAVRRLTPEQLARGGWT